jgi:uncharacterized protein YdiU (UPF0061 family)
VKRAAKPFLPAMLDYITASYFPAIAAEHPPGEDRYEALVAEVSERTARLVAAWQAVGFCHGVLNTDNMSIVGLTIDYGPPAPAARRPRARSARRLRQPAELTRGVRAGPFGFMDMFDPNFVCNHSDDSGRYSYAAQPDICRWNCQKLAEAVAPCLPLARGSAAAARFDAAYSAAWLAAFRRKLGLVRALDAKDAGRADGGDMVGGAGADAGAGPEDREDEAALAAAGISDAEDKSLIDDLLAVSQRGLSRASAGPALPGERPLTRAGARSWPRRARTSRWPSVR